MFDTIADLLRGSAPDDLAHALGTDRTQTRRAMEIGLPALITGLRDKTLEPGGAQSLATMLDDPSASLPSDVGAYLTEGDPSRGAAMLDVAFGDRGEPALSALSGASGLSTRLLAQVMSVLAPLATGTLRANAPRDADGLRSYLAGSVDDLEGKGFGRVVELVSPDVPEEAAPPVAEVIEAAGPAELDHMVDELDADAAVGGPAVGGPDLGGPDLGGTVVTGAFPDTPDFGNDVVVGLDDGDVPDFVADLDGPSMPDLSIPDAPDFSAPDVDLAVPEADLPDVAVPDFGPGPDFSAPDIVSDVAAPDIAAPDFAAPDFGAPDVAATATMATAGYPSDAIDASFGLEGETPIVEPKVDFDEGRGLSAMGWLWWLIGAILAVLLLLFLISQCTGDDGAGDVATGGDTTATAVPAADPTPDPLVAQRQAQLDNIIAEYPGVTGEVVGQVAVLNGTVADLRTKALLDGEVREAGLGVQNNVAIDESAAPAEPQGYSLNDLIAAQPELTTLASLLDQAGLGAALDANGPFTLFAPTNDAFAAIQTELNELQGDPERLSTYLQYHLLSGELTGADVASRPTLETISQEIIDVSVEGNTVRLNDFVPVLVADAEARNGVMHVISGVLTPPSEVPVPEELGSALELNAITFATGSADLTDGGRVELDKVVAFLLETPVDVVIGGHTDADGDEALNQSLSQDRADAVLTYLTSQGVPADTLTATGFGETQPIAPNDTPENKAKNRRIEFRTN